ncbi:MAG: hypothetical protein M3R13_01850 [Armatimonadota bacterium]|nr:hypothetical protein [Armatimonadota bacterium]
MRLLCVANWSEGRDEVLLAAVRDALRSRGATVHFDGSDADHNRVVTAFSGSAEEVRETLFSVAAVAFQGIDMRSHDGVHPRSGALDVCPFILLDGELEHAVQFVNEVAEHLAHDYGLPVFLYEHSETGRHAADLPSLRKGQYEGLFGRELNPDFGPSTANAKLGATVFGVRDWLLAVNVDLPQDALAKAKSIAREIRVLRDEGDPRMCGIRALGLHLLRRGLSQISMNLTNPEATSPDEIIRWIATQAEVVQTELIGVIREGDVANATLLPVEPNQIITIP